MKKVQLIEKKVFATAAFDLEYKAYIIYIVAFNITSNIGNKMHLLRRAQIAQLQVDKVLIKVFSEYADLIDIFLSKLAVKLFKYKGINNYAIELIDN